MAEQESHSLSDISTITHGLMVIDPATTTPEGKVSIVHFVGYWGPPTVHDIKHLLEELKDDPDFGFGEDAARLEILPAPEAVLEYFRTQELEDV